MSKPSEQSKTAIIGAGFIGRAWAISFARAGSSVRLWDEADGAPETAIEYISGVLDDLARNDLLNGAAPSTVLARIQPAATLEEAVAEASHIQENTPEVLDIKIRVFEKLDATAKADAVLASSTSAFATASPCGGHSWAHSKPSTSMRQEACATMPSAIRGFM